MFSANGLHPGQGNGAMSTIWSCAYSFGNVLLGLEDGSYTMSVLPATFDPKVGAGEGTNVEFPPADWFIPTDMQGLRNMMLYATGRATADGYFGKQNYRAIMGQTCVGFVIDTMDQADLWPKYIWQNWATANEFETNIWSYLYMAEGGTAEKLPAYNPAAKY